MPEGDTTISSEPGGSQVTAPVRIGVVGVGHLGRHHARLLSELPGADLTSLAEVDPGNRKKAEDTYQVAVFEDYRDLLGKIDAVSVVVPTQMHLEVSKFFLENGVDVLVEKPIAPSVAEGEQMVAVARAHDRILQVERFNRAWAAIREHKIVPRYIESNRLAPFSFRSIDIGVVLDLMIHDLDLVLAMVDSPLESVQAFGGAVFTPAEDMASAILRFENGAVANLTASRVALKPLRRMRLFCRDSYASLDFQEGTGTLIKKNPGWDFQNLEPVDPTQIDDLWKYVFQGLFSVEELKMDEGNPLRDELAAFLVSVRDRTEPVVSGEAGCAAVAIAERVQQAIAGNSW
jgi:predicted dehydrogenase